MKGIIGGILIGLSDFDCCFFFNHGDCVRNNACRRCFFFLSDGDGSVPQKLSHENPNQSPNKIK